MLAPALAPPPPSPSPRCSQPDEKEKDLISFLEACQLGDLNSSDPENPTVLKFLQGGINVRIECDKGEMPLHKLARVQLTDRNQVPRRARARASLSLLCSERRGECMSRCLDVAPCALP